MTHDAYLSSGDRANTPLRQAQRRAGMKLGWWMHAAAYVVVNAGLMALAFSHGRHWAIYPALGWGAGLLAHGCSVWLCAPGNPLWQRMVQRELDALPPGPPSPEEGRR